MKFDTYIILRQKAFNLVKEKSGDQKRYASPVRNDQPYWTHFMNVHNFLVIKGVDDKETLLAAILHDIVEDYKISAELIDKEFSPRVADTVRVLTKEEGWKSADYFEAIMNYRDHSAMQIKIADKIDNILTNYCYWGERVHSQRLIDEHERYLVKMAETVGWQSDLSNAMSYFIQHKGLSQEVLNKFFDNTSTDAVLE